MSRQVIIKPEGATPTKAFWRVVHEDERGEFVYHMGQRAYLKVENGQKIIDYWMAK
jgi:hypothetical protein